VLVLSFNHQEIVMPHTEQHANNSSSMPNDASQSLASRYREDVPPQEERIRGRAYELYVERGSRPGDSVADWLEAEREYYGRP
jgi:hypothetical protein